MLSWGFGGWGLEFGVFMPKQVLHQQTVSAQDVLQVKNCNNGGNALPARANTPFYHGKCPPCTCKHPILPQENALPALALSTGYLELSTGYYETSTNSTSLRLCRFFTCKPYAHRLLSVKKTDGDVNVAGFKFIERIAFPKKNRDRLSSYLLP